MLPEKIKIPKEVYKVYKTGAVFYDTARLIGAAHLFFGTASAQIEDKGAFWELSGAPVKRNESQILWIIEKLNLTNKERRLFEDPKKRTFYWDELTKFFKSGSEAKGRLEELKAEYDCAFQIGTRSFDPLQKYEILAPRSTGETMKKFKVKFQDLAAATLGRAFSAKATSFTNRQKDRISILPIFKEHFVISGFLDYEKNFTHSASGWVAAVWASVSILLELLNKGLPVVDFVYNREVKGPTGIPVFSESGFLGLEKLCVYWIENRDDEIIQSLIKHFKRIFSETRGQNTHESVKTLVRYLANFVVNIDVDSISKIQQIKVRLMDTDDVKVRWVGKYLLNKSIYVKEVKKMIEETKDIEIPDIPWQISESLAKALNFKEKGWMNQFTRLENSTNFTQFIQQVEHIISRGIYRKQVESGENLSFSHALIKAKNLSEKLRSIERDLKNEKIFRAWKAIFLLDVLSRAEMGKT